MATSSAEFMRAQHEVVRQAMAWEHELAQGGEGIETGLALQSAVRELRTKRDAYLADSTDPRRTNVRT